MIANNFANDFLCKESLLTNALPRTAYKVLTNKPTGIMVWTFEHCSMNSAWPKTKSAKQLSFQTRLYLARLKPERGPQDPATSHEIPQTLNFKFSPFNFLRLLSCPVRWLQSPRLVIISNSVIQQSEKRFACKVIAQVLSVNLLVRNLQSWSLRTSEWTYW